MRNLITSIALAVSMAASAQPFVLDPGAPAPNMSNIVQQFYGVATNNTPSLVTACANGSLATLTNGTAYVRSNATWVLLNPPAAQPAFPTGAIVMWSGTLATIPSGWHLCDGTVGTPNLRDKFVVCASSDSGGVAKSVVTGSNLQTGGSTTLSHTVNDPGHNHNNSNTTYDTFIYDQQVNEAGGDFTVSAGSFSVGPSDDALTGITVNNHSGVAPPFFALAYIQKL